MKKISSSEKCDVIILGAGAAGLAAADKLLGTGLKIRILEARNRIGGRILTHRDPMCAVPLELGAEFVHGSPHETFEIVNRAKLGLYDVLDSHVMKGPKGLMKSADDFWEKVGNVMGQLDKDRKVDRSFADFLKSKRAKESQVTLDLARSFAEGFHAADVDHLSEKGLAVAEQATSEAADEHDHSRSFRIIDGYRSIPDFLAEGLEPDSIRLNRVVREVHWERGRVTVTADHRLTGAAEVYEARAAVIALPHGVLAAEDGVSISPKPKQLSDALAGIKMGAAIRISFHFRHAFWENQANEPIGMIHASPEAAFPTWWTSLPFRAPVITAWAGGPKALAAYALPKAKRIRLALETLAELFDTTVDKLSNNLQSSYHHDWQKDPFSRGAYSWVNVNGLGAAENFASPVEETLYFAGEATNNSAARGTVDGALASGQRAARLVKNQLLET